MRQVNEAELVWNVKLALGRIGRQRLRGLLSTDHATHRTAVQLLAEDIVRHLDRYEVLSDAPLPEHRDLFTTAAYRDR